MVHIIFTVVFLFFVVYYSAFEYSRYRNARLLAGGLDGRAVFRIGRSYMRRDNGGVEERAWIAPDDKMAWGSVLSLFTPSGAVLFLQRDGDFGFRFLVEPKTGVLMRSISLNTLKGADFNVPRLDEGLSLRTSNRADATVYFSAPEKQQAMINLFLLGFTRVEGDHGVISATKKGASAEDISPERIGLYLGHLKEL